MPTAMSRAYLIRGGAVLVAAAAVCAVLVGYVAPRQDSSTTLALEGIDRCPFVQTRDALRGADVAFSGTILSVSDESVMVKVDHDYRGDVANTVRLVRAKGVAASSRAGTTWVVGVRYLVAGRDAQVIECSGGATGPWSQGLADSYAETFG